MTLVPPAGLEALLFASGEPMSRKNASKILGISAQELDGAIAILQKSLVGHGITVVSTGDEIELRTAPEAFDIVKAFRESELRQEIGRASLETLAIILYRQGATRGEIDYIRGVNSTTALRALTLRGLVARSEDRADKRRLRYTATVDALAHLGVSSPEELPRYKEFRKELEARESVPAV